MSHQRLNEPSPSFPPSPSGLRRSQKRDSLGGRSSWAENWAAQRHREVKNMVKSVHHVIDFTEVAHRRYWRDNGEQAPMPASGYEAAEHDGKSFVVVSNIDGPLAIYRIDFGKRDGLMAATDQEAAAVSKLLGYVPAHGLGGMPLSR